MLFNYKLIIEQVTCQVVKHYLPNTLGSYNPLGYRNDFLDDLDYMYDRGIEDDFEDDFVVAQRRYKDRAAAAFADDLADLRRKRRDMQVTYT